MAKKFYVFSTLVSDQRYVDWSKGASDLPIEGQSVFIKGGTGVANDRFVTPLGVMTEIDADQLKLLEANEMFKLHKGNGYITIQEKSADPEKVAADMSRADPSSPKTPSSYVDAGDNTATPRGD